MSPTNLDGWSHSQSLWPDTWIKCRLYPRGAQLLFIHFYSACLSKRPSTYRTEGTEPNHKATSSKLRLLILLKSESHGSTTCLRTFRLRHFVCRHFVYRHFVYYCIPASSTVIHQISVSENYYFHQFQLLFTLWFLFINPTSTDTMIVQYIQLTSIVAWQSRLFFQLKTLIFINPTSS